MKFNNVTPDIGERMLRTLLQLRAAQEGVKITELVITKKEEKVTKENMKWATGA